MGRTGSRGSSCSQLQQPPAGGADAGMRPAGRHTAKGHQMLEPQDGELAQPEHTFIAFPGDSNSPEDRK